MQAYKIVKYGKVDGWWSTLFHGIKGSKQMLEGVWYHADIRSVRDGSGGTYYDSGIHVLPSLADALKYMENFDEPLDKTIVLVECKDYVKKEHARGNVYLCASVKIVREVMVLL
jgi:hypothetical protein